MSVLEPVFIPAPDLSVKVIREKDLVGVFLYLLDYLFRNYFIIFGIGDIQGEFL